MGDVFNEQLIKHNNNSTEKTQQILLWVGAAVLCFITFFIPVVNKFAIIVDALIIAGAVFLNRGFSKEYEYIFTNGELDIDVILSQGKRKKVLTISVKQFILVAPTDDQKYKKDFENVQKVIDASTGDEKNSYSALYEGDKQTVKLIFSPNETMIKAIKTYAPRQTNLRP